VRLVARLSENSQVMGVITPNQPNFVAGVGWHQQQPLISAQRLPHRGSGIQFSDNLGQRESRRPRWLPYTPRHECRSDPVDDVRLAFRHLRGSRLHPPAGCRHGPPGVARSHECREGATGSCRTDSETRKSRKRVSARGAAQTRNARFRGRSRSASPECPACDSNLAGASRSRSPPP
jgi:hypothetical protein